MAFEAVVGVEGVRPHLAVARAHHIWVRHVHDALRFVIVQQAGKVVLFYRARDVSGVVVARDAVAGL
jgi:hypothetical protein